MNESESARGERAADDNQAGGEHRERRGDRRMDGGGIFGGYQGPERRSGRDRRRA